MKKLLSSAVGVATVLSLCAIPSQVHAGADSTGSGSAGEKNILGIAGSDTTTFVMEALSAAHNTNAKYNPDKDRAVNIPPLVAANPNVEAGELAAGVTRSWLADARSTWPGGIVLPADNDCKVNMVFGGYGSRDLADPTATPARAIDGDNNDGAVTGGLAVEGGTSASADLDGDSNTTDVGETWWLGLVPPNGSSNGRAAVAGSAIQNGVWYNGSSSTGGTGASSCLDIARSSSKETDGTRTPRLEGWAFALDAIGWTYFSGNSHGVAQTGLTQAQLKKIYSCVATPPGPGGTNIDPNSSGTPDQVGDRIVGYPEWSLWGDVTGNPADTTPIRAYRVQVGSGTGTDVATVLMGKTGGSNSNVDSNFLAGCGVGFSFPQVQEHDCRGVSDLHKPDAICFYGYSRWVIQAKALETDKRNGAVFGKFATTGDLKRPSFSSINETSARYAGTRYVYNYVGLNTDGSGEDLPRIIDSRRFVGVSIQPAGCADGAEGGADDCNFDGDKTDTVAGGTMTLGGQPGFICGDLTARKVIAAYGLKPLPLAATDPANGALGTSYCRLATSTNPAF